MEREEGREGLNEGNCLGRVGMDSMVGLSYAMSCMQ